MGTNPYVHPHVEDGNYPQLHQGMTLRDHFAGQALSVTLESYPDWQLKAWFGDRAAGITREQVRAKAAYAIADAMLAARDASR